MSFFQGPTIFKKKITTNEQLISLIKELKSPSQKELIEECITSFFGTTYCLNCIESSLSMRERKALQQFVKILLQYYTNLLETNPHEVTTAYSCLIKLSSIIAGSISATEILSYFVSTLFRTQNSDSLQQYQEILNSCLKNKDFTKSAVTNSFLTDIWVIIFSKTDDNSTTICNFLLDLLELSPSLRRTDFEGFNLLISNFLSQAQAPVLSVAAKYFKRLTPITSEDENTILAIISRASEIRECYFFHDLLNNIKACEAITDLFRSSNPAYLTKLIAFASQSEYTFSPLPFISRVKSLSVDDQALLSNIILRQKPLERQSAIELLIPPIKTGIDCHVLQGLVMQVASSDFSYRVLVSLLLQPSMEDLKEEFNLNGFSLLIKALFTQLDEFTNVIPLLSKIILLIKEGTEGSYEIFESICFSFQPAIYSQTLLASLSILESDKSFIATFPSIIKERPLLQAELRTPEYVKWAVDEGLPDFLTSILPYENVIDDEIFEHFEDSKLKYLPSEVLLNMMYGLPHDFSEPPYGTITIPSLSRHVPYEIHSLAERTSISQFLIRKNQLGIDDPHFSEFAVQILSPALANEIVDKPDILYEATNPKYPHRPVLQFTAKKENSFIELPEISFNFSFGIEEFKEETTILEFSDTQLVFDGQNLRLDMFSLPCQASTWHTVTVNLGRLTTIIIDGASFQTNTAKGEGHLPTFGSKSKSPGSTFYIDFHGKGNLSPNVVPVQYSGFFSFGPAINAIPRIWEHLIAGDFEYVPCILNISRVLKTDRKKLLSMLKIAVLENPERATEDLFQQILKETKPNIIDWELFSIFFIDIELWSKCHEKMGEVSKAILDYFVHNHVDNILLEKYSIVPFLLDLTNIFADFTIESTIYTIYSANFNYFLPLLTKNPNPSTANIVPYFCDKIPINYITQIPTEFVLTMLSSFAKKCLSDDALYDEQFFPSLKNFFASFVDQEKLWISLFQLMTKMPFTVINDFSRSPIERPSVLKMILNLACRLYGNPLLKPVISCLVSIMQQIDLSPYLSEIQSLLHFGIPANKFVVMPADFGTSIEPCRMQVEENEEPYIIEMNGSKSFQKPTSKQFVTSIFGHKPNYELLDSELEKIFMEEAEEVPNKEVDCKALLESEELQEVLKLAIKALIQSNDLEETLSSLLVFGPDVGSELSIGLHRLGIISFLKDTAASIETLRFIHLFVSVGWWEDSLTELFDAVCMSCNRPIVIDDEAAENARMEEFGNVIKLIFALSPDVSKLHINENRRVIITKRLLKNKQYFLCLLAAMMSESFMESRDSASVWSYFALSLDELDASYLNKLFEGIFEPGEIISGFSRMIDFDGFDPLLKERTQRAAAQFVANETSQMAKRNSIVRKMRLVSSSSVNRQDVIDAEKEVLLIDKALRSIERKAFQMRNDFVSLQNEEAAYQIWLTLPDKRPTNYQIAPSVHPISTPTVYSPFISDIKVSQFRKFLDFETVDTEFGKTAEIPQCLPRFIARPFTYSGIFFEERFGTVIEYNNCFVLHESSQIPVVIAKTSDTFYLLFSAKYIDNSISLIKANSLTVVGFFDAICARYYGNSTLFYGHPVLFFDKSDLLITVPRNFCSMATSLEAWFSRGFSLLFIFESESKCQQFKKEFKPSSHIPKSISDPFSAAFSNYLCKMVKKNEDLHRFQKEWVEQRLSTYIYLLILNFFSDRSFSNVSQYPVMPWVKDRDLSKPMGQQTEGRTEKYQSRYDTAGYFYGTLYLSPLLIYHFLIRIQPHTLSHIELQNGFDVSDRLFFSISSEWMAASKYNEQCIEELIPEFFTLPEFLQNENDLPIPSRGNGIDIRDILPIPGYSNFVSFVWDNRKHLEHAEQIEKWIDLIFGIDSRGENALKKKNIFHPAMYGQIPEEMECEKPEALQAMMIGFGQIPSQLFKESHPKQDTVMFSRPLLLTDSDALKQGMKTFVEADDEFVIEKKDGIYGLKSVKSLFNPLKEYNDGVFEWNLKSGLSAISRDRLLYATVISGCQSVAVYRAICQKSGVIEGYVPMDILNIPKFVTFRTINSVAVSSHLFIACVVSGRYLASFRLGCSKFIRVLKFSEEIEKVLIDDSYQCFFGFGKSFIEVFTINGTFVGRVNCEKTITSVSLAVNDFDIFAATGHENGSISLWKVDPERGVLFEAKKIDTFSSQAVIAVEVMAAGSALFAIDKEHKAALFVTSGCKEEIATRESSSGCAGCGRLTRPFEVFRQCSNCKLFFCDDCCVSTQGVLCRRCIEAIDNALDLEI